MLSAFGSAAGIQDGSPQAPAIQYPRFAFHCDIKVLKLGPEHFQHTLNENE